jgi:hypothetical protein
MSEGAGAITAKAAVACVLIRTIAFLAQRSGTR